jgi:hypothetical protein
MQESREKKYPFKFLDSYNRNDTDIFFGRDEEIKDLYEMVSQNPMVLVYGPSGTGKTSLIQCGLAGKFKSYDWLPLTVRREGDINKSLEKSLVDNGGNAENFDEELEDTSENELNGLVKLIKGVYLNNFKTTYFIFDQFEELYILGNKDEEDRFITAIKDILAAGQPVKFIFSIREEYLGYLYRLEKVFPQLLRKKLRVEPMTSENLKKILTGINNLTNSNISINAKELDLISDKICEKLSEDNKTHAIELPYMQVFMDKLYLDLTKDKVYKTDALITLESVNRMNSLGNVLKSFLEDQVEQVRVLAFERNTRNNISESIIWKILSPFATLEGTKDPILKDEIERRIYDKDIEGSLVSFCIDEFVNRRILNFSQETELYELAHDSLAKCIAGKRTDEDIKLLEVYRLIKYQASIKEGAREFFSEKQLKIINPCFRSLEPNLSDSERELVGESEKKIAITIAKRKTKRFLALTITVLVIAFAGWQFFDKRQKAAEKIQKEKFEKLTAINGSTNKEQKLLPFFYTLEELDLEKDASKYNELIERAKKWKAYPTYTLEKIFFDSTFKIGWAAFGTRDSIIYLLNSDGKTLKAWDYNAGKILWTKAAELQLRQSHNSLIEEERELLLPSPNLKTNQMYSLNISDSSLFFVKKYIDSVVKNWYVPGLPILPTIINQIRGASFSYDGQSVITWGKNSESKYDAADFWSSENYNIGMSVVHKDIQGAAFSPDTKMVLTWDDSTARLWSYTNDTTIFRLPSYLFKLRSQVETGLELSPLDNTTLLTIPLSDYYRRREEYFKLYNDYVKKLRKK